LHIPGAAAVSSASVLVSAFHSAASPGLASHAWIRYEQQLSSLGRGLQCWARECRAQEQREGERAALFLHRNQPRKKTAELLGVNPTTLIARIKKLGLRPTPNAH
jgi:DNA-binding NtrC family response regulator